MNNEIIVELDGPTDSARQLKLNNAAISNDADLPAFLARPEEAPVYRGFPMVLETMTDGWCLGAITEYEDPDGCDSGDAYVVAPDGSRAGLVWDVGEGKVSEICPPEKGRWGVYQIWFSEPVRTTEDLVERFREVLPDLQEIYDGLQHK
ncbi:MAG: 3-deoxy-8-phosphooctulonate synthase [Pyrinomonadaceae bacterium]